MLKDYFLLTLLNYRQDYKMGTGIPVRAQRINLTTLHADGNICTKPKTFCGDFPHKKNPSHESRRIKTTPHASSPSQMRD